MQNLKTLKHFTITLAFIFGFNIHGYSQTIKSTVFKKEEWKIFSELDLGLLALTGGIGIYSGVRKGPHSFELGYHHFKSPEAFGGTPEEFDLKVDYIYSVNYSCFWNGKTDKGLYTRFMYQNKKQNVTEQSSGISKNLYSDLVGAELGYVFRINKGIYIIPRIGALYYIKSPQGKDNNPVLVGNSYYDNDRHKTWDTYFIPTVSIGYSFPLKKR
jgi:hypothetical protein